MAVGLTLRELVERLAPLIADHGNTVVQLEGCDCVEDLGGVTVTRSPYYGGDPRVALLRAGDGSYRYDEEDKARER